MRKQANTVTVSIVLMFVGIFIYDVLTPPGYVEWVLYLIPLLIVSKTLKRERILLLAVFNTALIIIGLLASPGKAYSIMAIHNRLIGIAVIWTISFLIAQRNRLEGEIKHQAHHDFLTGLPNRKLFMDMLAVALAQAGRNQKKLAILCLDLDRFKEVNDTLGHAAGDQLLREVSVRLRNSVRRSDVAARMGGDEFNILLSNVASTGDVTIIADKIIAALRKPFMIDGRKLQVSASIGISVCPDDSEDGALLLKYADTALCQAKEYRNNAYRFYNPAVTD